MNRIIVYVFNELHQALRTWFILTCSCAVSTAYASSTRRWLLANMTYTLLVGIIVDSQY